MAAGCLELRQGDAAALPWGDATFDAVAFFREVWRVLKPGRRFAVVTTGKHKLASILFGLWYPTLKLYRDAELAELLRSAGFAEVETKSLDIENQIGSGVKN